MRRTFALAPSMLALLVVALLARSAGVAEPFASEGNARGTVAPAQAIADRADGRATEPDGRARILFLHAQAPSTGRVQAPYASGGDGARGAAALGVERASLDDADRSATGAAVEAREYGVSSPGQPAPSSRAPPIG